MKTGFYPAKTVLIMLFIAFSVTTAGVATASETKTFDIQITDRKVVGDNHLVRVTLGDEVVLNWQTDESVTVHLHGYDIERRIVAGEPAKISFTAHATGRFPVTSHGFENQHDGHGHEALLYFEVYPD